MPELPEVTTTVNGLNKELKNKTILGVWTDYHLRSTHKGTNTIKNKKYSDKFIKEIVSEKILGAERRGKNVLIHFTNNKTVLIHMKMTGHLLYGTYKWNGDKWKSDDKNLSDSFNQFIHLIFNLSNGKSLAFSDMRKFAKVIMFETDKRELLIDLSGLGIEPLEDMTLESFMTQLSKKPNGKIKTVLMDQSLVVGIGNIYSDEILWDAGIHPERAVKNISKIEMKKIWLATKKILTKSITMGGDSMSDYRNIYGEKGSFQNLHKAYRQTGKKCTKKGCAGIILRKIIGGRSTHFCSIHQKM